MKFSTRELCHIGLFVAVTAIMAQIIIPLPVVPFTMQTFAVALSAAVLGAKKGFVVLLIYILLGAVGVPVFTGFGAGFARITGPWGGYILSFPIFALIVGFGADKESKPWLALGLGVGVAVNLFLGSLQLSYVNQLSLSQALLSGFVPFIIPEIIKMTMVFAVAPRIRAASRKFMPVSSRV